MRMLMLFLSCLMLVSASTGAVRAAEIGPCSEMSQAAHAPVSCDGSENSADCEKNCPRHLNCHGQQVGTPVATDLSVSGTATRSVFGAVSGNALASHELDQALRPPQA
jgi:hypothetical protein